MRTRRLLCLHLNFLNNSISKMLKYFILLLTPNQNEATSLSIFKILYGSASMNRNKLPIFISVYKHFLSIFIEEKI